ncbi:MAG: winged helix-turn-helix transcriptional regulator [Lachnospiraceae bacterium]|nr:winged helix-turn-helix transcriptional regulator [Lachnospiraceae bacterium]
MFIGREDELALIQEILGQPRGSMMIYGKHKIGKTTLLTHALKAHPDKTVYYECLKAPMKDNIEGFVSVLVRMKVLPVAMSFNSLMDVFTYLNTLPQTLNIIIDEYPYLRQFTESVTVDSLFQNIIDNSLSNIRLFISGSHVGMMKDLLEENNALYGRFQAVICLKELDYRTVSAFYHDKSPYDKVGMYAVFGGSPYINELLMPSASLKENVIRTILNPSSAVYHYADNLLLSDLSVSSNMERILLAIANGKKRYTEIEEKLNMPSNGLLSKQMKTLLNMELVSKITPVNKPNDNRKARYEITDNLLRFFYTYVYSNKSALQMLGAEAFYEEYIEPSLVTFISHRFEDVCRTYFSLQVRSRKLKGVLNIGTYYYDDSSTRTRGEFDVVLQRKDAFDIYEVKYLVTPMTQKQMQEEIRQVAGIKGIRVGAVGLISISGFEAENNEYICLDGASLYW